MKMKYAVANRYGTQREFGSRRDAERYARDERADGWPAQVRDMVSGQVFAAVRKQKEAK